MTSPSLGSERPKSKRRWLQFSLSMLFVLTLAVAGFLSGYQVGERRWNQYHVELPVSREYDVADLVRMVDPGKCPPTQNSESPDARKSATTAGFGGCSRSEHSVARPSGPMPDSDSLIELITTAIEPAKWEEVGEVGTIAPHEQSLTLVIHQYPLVHEEIEVFLPKLRLLQKLRAENAARAARSLRNTSP